SQATQGWDQQFPVPTPYPEMNDVQMAEHFRLLGSDECKLPCYLGISLGMPILQASNILESQGALKMQNALLGSGSLGFVFNLSISDSPVLHSIYLLPNEDGELAGISISLTSRDAPIWDYWARYTTRGLFRELGRPDGFYIEDGD